MLYGVSFVADKPRVWTKKWFADSWELETTITRRDGMRFATVMPVERPLTPEQDELLQQEFLRRNDLGANLDAR